ncbi:sigma-70 family RNA polymerase sigma factor [Leptobacterium flavescens]|uniref:Sigma-70 family RNA polymerase sigma factor n=1 Tax=Leptobacterium flavescens TaxID=472055 RepID=A0A6P0UMD2_9FLAO|nr:RNA polymerase sigma factor [Leptobacterium flavescens]NER14394.1 sigma-70 family RNA polymerase sigma factor [Leptobacterium flavescens]
MPSTPHSLCDEEVFEKAYKEHIESLRNFMFYKCGDLDEAEDYAQEAFVRLWNNCEKVILGKVSGYLYTVANNIFLKAMLHKKVVLKYEQRPRAEKTSESPEFIMLEKEFLDKLQKAIADLPEGQREVFLLNRIDKKTYNEIAEMLGVSVKAIEKRMHKALLKLRKSIGPDI